MTKVNLLNVRDSLVYFRGSRDRQRMDPVITQSLLWVEDDVEAERNWILAGLDMLLSEDSEDGLMHMHTSPFGGQED